MPDYPAPPAPSLTRARSAVNVARPSLTLNVNSGSATYPSPSTSTMHYAHRKWQRAERSRSRPQLAHELAFLSGLRHTNIARFYGAYMSAFEE